MKFERPLSPTRRSFSRARLVSTAAAAALAGLLGVACGSAPIDGSEGDGSGGAAECSNDADCDYGVCSAAGQCVAECGAASDCGDGEFCSSRGVCEPIVEVGDPGSSGCSPDLAPISETVEVEVPVERTEEVVVTTEVAVTPTVMLLVDRSASMDWQVTRNRTASDGESRWDIVNDALFNTGDGLVKPLESDVAFGLVHYTNGSTVQNSCVGFSRSLGQVSFATNNFKTLSTFASSLGPRTNGETPTGESLELAATHFASVTTEGRKHLILVTDGMPDTCAHPSADLAFGTDAHNEAKELVVDAADAASQAGVTVHVIGIGPDGRNTHFEEVATAGGGVFASASTDSDVYTAFADVLEDIRTEERTETRTVTDIETRTETQLTCRLNITFSDAEDASRFVSEGSVSVSGQSVSASEWRLNADGEVELLGAACTQYLASSAAVAASLGCATAKVL